VPEMRFKGPLMEAIPEGRKTVTRRPVDQFLIAWGSIYGWPIGDPEVWRIEFTLAPESWRRDGGGGIYTYR